MNNKVSAWIWAIVTFILVWKPLQIVLVILTSMFLTGTGASNEDAASMASTIGDIAIFFAIYIGYLVYKKVLKRRVTI